MNPERLAYWYFRLNGFMTIEDFVVHPDRGKLQRTDADILAVRFMHREENAVNPMIDDSKVSQCETLINVIIAEVKKNRCDLNGPWTDPNKANMERVLRSIGCIPLDIIDGVSHILYNRGFWFNDHVTIRLFAIGESVNNELPISVEQQLTWAEVITFCHQRFNRYRKQKSSVGIWASDGICLQRLAERREPDVAGIRHLFGLYTSDAPELGRTLA